MVIAQQIKEFLDFQKSCRKSDKTIALYSSSLNNFFLEYLPQLPSLDKLTLVDIMGYTVFLDERAKVNKLKEVGISGFGRKTDGDKLKASTLNRHFAAIRQFLIFHKMSELAKQIKSFKVSREGFDIIPFEDIKVIFDKNTLQQFYEDSSTRKSKNILFYIDRLSLLINFDFSSGLRLNEVFELKKTDLKLNRVPPEVEVMHGKGDKFRKVVLSEKWIKEYNEFLAKAPHRVKESEYIFTKFNGERLQYSTIKISIKKVGYFIGVNKLSFHKLRHCFAIQDYLQNKDIVSLSKKLGHKDIKTTAIYLNEVFFKDKNQKNFFDSMEVN